MNADLGAEEDLLKKLREIPNVKEVYVVYGVYDIVARVEADTMEKVKETITWHIRRLDKVRSTLTMIVVEALLAIFRPSVQLGCGVQLFN